MGGCSVLLSVSVCACGISGHSLMHASPALGGVRGSMDMRGPMDSKRKGA